VRVHFIACCDRIVRISNRRRQGFTIARTIGPRLSFTAFAAGGERTSCQSEYIESRAPGLTLCRCKAITGTGTYAHTMLCFEGMRARTVIFIDGLGARRQKRVRGPNNEKAMTKDVICKILSGLPAVLAVTTCLLAQAKAQTATENARGNPTVATKKLAGVVMYAEGSTLIARMSTGEVRTFAVPNSVKFVIDGKEVTISELRPGTSLKATIVTTTTPVTERTVTNIAGTVWFVSGNTVVLTLADGENRTFTSLPEYKFKVNGRDATVFDLRKGMKVSAEKIVEQPRTEVATNTTVFGGLSKTSLAQVPRPSGR